MKRKYVILSCSFIVLALAVVALSATAQSPGRLPPQPIPFNHRLHLENVQGIRCQDCHQFVISQTYAGLPSKFICFECHSPDADEDETDADAFRPEFAKLMSYAKTSDDIPWHRVTTRRDDVFFSHRRHVVVGKIDCRECHPEMPDRTSPPTRGPIEMSMSTCIDCHNETNASIDCVSCHL